MIGVVFQVLWDSWFLITFCYRWPVFFYSYAKGSSSFPNLLITLLYRGCISYKLKRLLEQFASAKVVFSSSPTLKNHLGANGKRPSSAPDDPRGTVYKVDCSCGITYVGETGRPLSIRIKEHRSSVTKPDQKSAVSQHLENNPNHVIQWDNVQPLCVNVNNTTKRKFMEAIQIRRFSDSMNRDQGLLVPHNYHSLINKKRDN